jgi:DNA-binding transcriptional LysR family regulator
MMIPNLDPNNLVIFYLVAKEGSLSAAADRLFLTQPAITYRLKSLEESTGVKLLEFKKRQVTLTPHGQELFKYAEEIYRQLVNAEGLIRSIKESYLRVGSASMFISIVSPVIKKMFEEHPEVKLTVKSGDATEMVQDVMESRLDLAIVPQFFNEKEKLTHITVSAPQKIVCFASYNQIIEKEPLSWGDLANYPLISGPEDSIIRKMITDKMKENGLEGRHFVADVDSIEWCKKLVENGQGISFTIAGDIEEQIAQKRLKLVETEESLFLTAEAVVRSDMFMNRAIKEFIARVKRAFGYSAEADPHLPEKDIPEPNRN